VADDAIVLLAVVALSASQLFQKAAVERSLRGAEGLNQWLHALFCPELGIAVMLLASGTALWLYGLFEMDVSRAFPFLSLGSVFVTLLARFVFKEHIDLMRWAGVALVTLGVMLVAAS
jgi:undecaprenyl phosphate-alpha-L-ara4N flippase subunit ArnE